MHPYEGLRPNLVPLDALMADYRDYAGKIGDRGRKSDESLIGKMLKEIFGKELGSRWRAHAVKRLEKNEDGTFETTSVRVWCRNFPSLQRSRQLFLKFYGAEAHADWFGDENQEWEIRAIYFTNR